MQDEFITSSKWNPEKNYGLHTHRSLQAFPSEGLRTLGDFPVWVKAVLEIKEAAAMANQSIYALEEKKASAIISSCQNLKRNIEDKDYPSHFLSGGGCTSIHMNVNEVIASKAEKNLGYKGERYSLIDPLDHVNLNQSTNDVMVTASNVAILHSVPGFTQKAEFLLEQMILNIKKNGDTPFLSRTCLQDAEISRFADLSQGWLSLIKRRYLECKLKITSLLKVNLGGTMIGKVEDVPSEYLKVVVPYLRQTTNLHKLQPTDNYFDMAQNPDVILDFFSSLDLLARSLIKVCKDIRLLNSGPEGGFAEINLPNVVCGSSVLPAKKNPVIAEFVIQSCFKVMGNYYSAQLSLEHGELHLNVWESLVITSLLESIKLLEHSCASLATFVFSRMELNKKNCLKNADSLSVYLMEAKKHLGYQKVDSWAKKIYGDHNLLKQEIKKQLMTKKENT